MVNIQRLTKKVKRNNPVYWEQVCCPLKVSVYLNKLFSKLKIKTTIWANFQTRGSSIYYVITLFDDNKDNFAIYFSENMSLAELTNKVNNIEAFISGELTYEQLRYLYL